MYTASWSIRVQGAKNLTTQCKNGVLYGSSGLVCHLYSDRSLTKYFDTDLQGTREHQSPELDCARQSCLN